MTQLSKRSLSRLKTRLERRREVLKENIRAVLANTERESMPNSRAMSIARARRPLPPCSRT